MIKKLIPVLAVLAAALIVVSTGAFTSVSATRTAEIYVAGDASALLALAPYDGPNGDYASYNDAGALTLDFEAIDAAGVNVDAITTFSNVFTVTNNGAQDVTLTLTKTGDNASAASFGDIESGVTLKAGKSYTASYTINTTGLSAGAQVLASITLVATA